MLYKTSVRNLWKNKSHTLINVLGLSLGITCAIVLFLLIRFWLSFDTFHSKADRIYRLVQENTYQGNTDTTPGVPVPMADALRNDFPEIEEVVFMSYKMGGLISVEDELGDPKNFQETEGIVYVDSNFFAVLDRPLLLGNPEGALNAPNQVIIDATLAEKYYGKDWHQKNVIGKIISFNKDTDLEITAVAEAYPNNTDFPFTMLISYATFRDEMEKDGGWGSTSSDNQVYVLLDEGISAATINERLPEFIKKYDEPLDGELVKPMLQPLSELHYDPRFSGFAFSTVPRYVINTLIAVASFLLIIASINFINLATAIATKRAKEVGIRKTMGSSRLQLARIFMTEAVLITFISLLIALGATELLMLRLNNFLDLQLELNLFKDPVLLLFVFAILIVVSALAGTYPAWVLTRFDPVRALKSDLKSEHGKGLNLRRSLIVFQFVIAQMFIISTLILLSQIDFIRSADLGFKQQDIVSIELPGKDKQLKKTFKREALRIPGVEGASLNYSSPTSGSTSVTSFTINGDENTYHTQMKFADQDYLPLFEIDLLAGTNLGEVDTLSRVVVNETFLKTVGIKLPEDALGREVDMLDRKLPIVGVMKDFHTTSLTRKIEPTLLADLDEYRKADLLLSTQNIPSVMGKIEDTWKELYPEYDFEYQFVDEEVGSFYREVEKLSIIISIAAGIVVFIGCLGLYGLVTYMAEQKTKEVGVRKVLGASVVSIVGLFSKEFVQLIAIAFLLAAPFTYWFMSDWLENFEYKINIDIGLFASGIGLTLLIALLTISYRAIQTARTNPAQSLRSD